jgi:Leucine-rich repeat (LRR) protein
MQLTLLTSLAHLDISSNCLSVIPDDIATLAPSLTFLDVSNNSRVVLPEALGSLSKLVQLNISWVWSDLSALWEGAAGLSSLQVG